MPATHRIEIHKSLGTEEWCNTYLMQCANMTEAQDFGNLLVTFERNLHWDLIHFDYFLCSTITRFDRVFRHVAINQVGINPSAPNHYLPLFNTVRIDFSTLDSDPCRKYYRLPVMEPIQDDGVIVSANLALFNAAITTYFFDTVMGDNLYSPKGHVVVSGTTHPQIQMRQLHRKRKKKVVA